MVANDKNMLDGLEADVAVPSLKLCIEWNGIVHFQPIFGKDKLNRIQTIDTAKQIIAQHKGIQLIVIPDLVSTEKFIVEAFQKITPVIRELIKEAEGVEPS